MVELTVSKKRELVEALRTDYSVREICDTLGFNRSLLYYQPKSGVPSDEVSLRDEIHRLASRYPTYGYRRITEMLVRMGYDVGYRRVARLMKADNLTVAVKRACRTTQSLQRRHQWGNRIDNLAITQCDQVWVGDITYVRLKGHFVYVALLMDVFTRMIRGWQVSRHLTEPLTLTPLQQALSERVPEIHHSDQGVQYLSKTYISTLEAHGVEISLAQRGCPWENGYAERLIRTLKEEEVHLNDYDNISEVQARIGYFIEQVYNQKRPHSALDYLTPTEFEQQNLA